MHDTTAMEVSSGILFLSAILKGREITTKIDLVHVKNFYLSAEKVQMALYWKSKRKFEKWNNCQFIPYGAA